jgi:electron transfer flavoprotein alpha subunit
MSEYKGVLVFCEVSANHLTAHSRELLGAGARLAAATGREMSAALIGSAVSTLAPEAVTWGANRVYLTDDPLLKDFNVEVFIAALEKIVKQSKPEIILLGQTTVGRDLAPWLAFRFNSTATMDCLALEIDATSGRLLMTRPVYGGNALAVQRCESDPQIVTLRSKAVLAANPEPERQGQIITVPLEFDSTAQKVKVMERKTSAGDGIKLEEARMVVAGGRGIGSAAGFKQLEELAALLQAAIGATRPPCDNKWTADNHQIGLTGKVVSPDLYFAIGLSGASQHLSGCSSAKTIVAINKDPEANIFKVAKYGIVADWKAVVPALCASIKGEK